MVLNGVSQTMAFAASLLRIVKKLPAYPSDVMPNKLTDFFQQGVLELFLRLPPSFVNHGYYLI
jgi:hypothetical protein